MIINSSNNNFYFTFPTGFFHEDIKCKYKNYIMRNFMPYDTLDTYMAAQIQSVTFPTISMDPVQQTRRFGKVQEYKNSTPIADLFTRDIQVTFKSLDGYINYWIFLDNALKYLSFDTKQLYFDDLQMRFIDQDGYIVTTTKYQGVVFKGMSEISISYSDNAQSFKTFTATFGFNKMDIFIDHD